MIGKTLAHYEILEPLGAGGMGEVYRARDTKLDRDVAIKVLPEDFATDPDRLARFEREAKLLASLNHGNIAAIYGLEDEGEQRFIVMEVVEGETLAERSAGSGRIDVTEALEIARQIAEALEAAHENGVIHRDLKPANIKITPEGKVKVLDFGLAKAYEPDGSPSEISPDLSHSPTMAAATRTGVIMGTAAYMSPEQARGKPVDKRSDIWAFGCVLFEMLTGKRTFGGETVSDTMAAILKEEPVWEVLDAATPAAVVRVLHRCLAKDRRERLHDIADARIEIVESLAGRPEWAVSGTPEAGGSASYRKPGLLAAGFIAGAALAALSLWVMGSPSGAPSDGPLNHFEIELPGLTPVGPSIALSPDGQHLVYVGRDETGHVVLFHRSMGDVRVRPIEGTQGAAFPFFSPDGRSIGFHAQGELRRVAIEGGPPQPICEVAETWGSAWGPNDMIVFGTAGAGLFQVSAGGGQPVPLTTPDPEASMISHRWPEILPDGDTVVFTVWRGTLRDATVATLSLSEPQGTYRELTTGTSPMPTPNGYLLFGRDNALMAAPFDSVGKELTGEPVRVLDDAHVDALGNKVYRVSRDGTIIYLTTEAAQSLLSSTLMWVDRATGNPQPVFPDGSRGYSQPAFDRSGDNLALTRQSADGSVRLWVLDVGPEGRVTPIDLDPDGVSAWPVWSPDGNWIAAVSQRQGGQWNMYRWKADGSGDFERLTFDDEARQIPTSWSIDGPLAFEQGSMGQRDVWLLGFDEDGDPQGEPQPLLVDPRFNERAAKFSPDGDWIAFTSDRGSGRDEIWLMPAAGDSPPKQVSIGGGREPVWSRDGTELFYRLGDKMMAVAIEYDPAPRRGTPQPLFTGSYSYGYIDWSTNYDVSPGGERFVMVREPPAYERRLQVLLNWSHELERLVAGAR